MPRYFRKVLKCFATRNRSNPSFQELFLQVSSEFVLVLVFRTVLLQEVQNFPRSWEDLIIIKARQANRANPAQFRLRGASRSSRPREGLASSFQVSGVWIIGFPCLAKNFGHSHSQYFA